MFVYRRDSRMEVIKLWVQLALLVGVAATLLGALTDPTKDVSLEVLSFQPDAAYEYTFPGTDITLPFEGIAEVKWTVCNGRQVVIQQTPDLKTWLNQEPLEITQLPDTDEGCLVYKGIFQILIDPVDFSDDSQFFRARILE